jgi:GntR family transcriptional regulator
MQPQMTAGTVPVHLQIADYLRGQIATGQLQPGSLIPSAVDLAQQWNCSVGSARSALNVLRSEGHITTGRGKPATVRIPPRQVVRSSVRHQIEKNAVLLPEAERARIGTAEIESGVAIAELTFRTDYSSIEADTDLALALMVDEGTPLLRRSWEMSDPKSGRREAWSVSYIPTEYLRHNPAISDPANEPWPGGTQHQLSTVGIEVMTIIDQVTAHMPTTPEAQLWDLPSGVPMLHCRRISIDQHGRSVEVSDAEYPADRTRLDFITPLTSWPKS